MDSTTTLTPAEVIDAVRAAREAEQAAAAEQLRLALVWAHLHPCPAEELPAHWGEVDLHGEGLMPLAGPGAPWVAEFAPADLAAALGISHDRGRELVGDALELAHRLPRLWELVQAGRVPVWRARAISRETHDLCLEAATFADKLICATPDKIGLVDARRLVDEARLFFDPDRAAADEEAALAKRGVWTRPSSTPATTELWMTLDTPDARLFDQTLNRVAAELATLGDTTDHDVRRARAVGVLADPQYALDLLSGRNDAAPSAGAGTMEVFVHLTPTDLAAELAPDGSTGRGTGGAVVDRLGAATTELIGDWLARHTAAGGRVRIRPVLDLNTHAAVDQHDPPEPMRELIRQRDAHCVFPACRRDSRSCDLDHIAPYVPMDEGGPPGQTNPANLAPLCRSHHRIKTHTAWHYQRHPDGSYSWTSPTGHHYTVQPASRRPAGTRAA